MGESSGYKNAPGSRIFHNSKVVEPGGSPGLLLEPRDPVPLVSTHGLLVPLWGHDPQAKSPLDSLSLASEFVTKSSSFGSTHSNPVLNFFFYPYSLICLYHLHFTFAVILKVRHIGSWLLEHLMQWHLLSSKICWCLLKSLFLHLWRLASHLGDKEFGVSYCDCYVGLGYQQ